MRTGRVCRCVWLACGVLLTPVAPLVAAQSDPARRPSGQTPGQTPRQTPAARPPRRPGTGTPASAEFDRLVKAATEARQAERWEDAIDLYAKAVKLKPQYVEGYWYQGTASYSLDNYTQGRDAFRKVHPVRPN